MGPAPLHYRNWTFNVPSTGGFCTTGQARFYPQHCEMPRERPMDEVRQIAADLSRALSFVLGRNAPKTSRHLEALNRLSTIFGRGSEGKDGRACPPGPDLLEPNNEEGRA